MANTPQPPAGENIETMVVPSKKQRGYAADQGTYKFPSQSASYTPDSNINEHSYGADGGKAAAQSGTVPSNTLGGASEVGVVPAVPATLVIGADKNVSTPVTGG